MRNEWTAERKCLLVLDLLSGKTSVDEAARQHELDRETIEGWKAFYLRSARQALRSTRSPLLDRLAFVAARRSIRMLAVGLASAVVLFVSLRAASDTPKGCNDHDPANKELCVFQAGEPAVADEVNSNFDKLLAWLEMKTGERGDGDIRTKSIDASGAVSTSTLSIREDQGSLDITDDDGETIVSLNEDPDGGVGGDVAVEGDLAVTGSLDVTGGANVGGQLGWGHNEDDLYPILPDDFCVFVPMATNGVCPAGWHSRTIKWDTEDTSNADSKDYVVAWDCGSTSSVCVWLCCRGNNWP
jgi:transposase-like protein